MTPLSASQDRLLRDIDKPGCEFWTCNDQNFFIVYDANPRSIPRAIQYRTVRVLIAKGLIRLGKIDGKRKLFEINR